MNFFGQNILWKKLKKKYQIKLVFYPFNLIKIAIASNISKTPTTINAIIKIFVNVELLETFDALLIVVEDTDVPEIVWYRLNILRCFFFWILNI